MPLHLKPNVVQDIYRPGETNLFRPQTGASAARLNLRHEHTRRIPVSKILRAIVIAWAAWIFVLGSATAPTIQTFAAGTTVSSDERTALEAQLKDLEGQISQYEDQIVGYQKQGKSLSGEITTLNSKIAKLNLQIKAVDLTLGQLDKKITDTGTRITETESTIATNRDVLGSLVKSLYQNDQASLMQVFLANPKISDFFGDLNNISLLQANIKGTITEIQTLQDQLKDQQEQFALARADAETIRKYQAAQKVETDSVKKTKDSLLAVTKGQESKYQVLLTQTKATAAEIRKRIFQFLGGGEMSFGEAYNFAKLASDATGVRPALILAVLDRESALGKNVGRCTYQDAMSPKNQVIYLELVKDLGIAPDSVMVSCANGDGVYGGAMGPSQFIPSTWMGYTDRVSAITGRTPANPWNNADAFVATALYLKDSGAGGSIDNDRKAAARYYAGGNWSRFLWTYGEAVISHAAQFEDDIATLNGT
jgi:membrane-bound lytic murein transglycosylase B